MQDGAGLVDPGDQSLIRSLRDALYFSSMVFIGRTPGPHVHLWELLVSDSGGDPDGLDAYGPLSGDLGKVMLR